MQFVIMNYRSQLSTSHAHVTKLRHDT